MSRHFFAPVPLDFDQAFKNGDIRPGAYLLGCHLAAESYRAKNTDAGIVTLHVSPLAELCGVVPQTVRRWLRALEQSGWIEFEVDERQRGPWRIRLSGLAKDHDRVTAATPELQHVLQSPTGHVAVPNAENPAQRVGKRPSREAVDDAVEPVHRRDETRPEERKTENLCSEEKLDHVVGETTAAELEPEFPELLDGLEPNPFHEPASLSGDERARRLEAFERARRFDARYPPRRRRA